MIAKHASKAAAAAQSAQDNVARGDMDAARAASERAQRYNNSAQEIYRQMRNPSSAAFNAAKRAARYARLAAEAVE